MKFDVDNKNRCRLVCVKFHLDRCRFAVAVAKCFGGSLFWDTVYNVLRGQRCATVSAVLTVECVIAGSASVHLPVQPWTRRGPKLGQ